MWTDRPQRGPQDDDYRFVSPDKFDRASESGQFDFQTGVFGNRYGIRHYTPPEATFPLYILSYKFAFGSLVRDRFEKTRTVFIDRPQVDYDRVLRERDPLISPDELSARLGSIATEYRIGDEYADIVFPNIGTVDEATEQLYVVLSDEVTRMSSAASG